MGTPPERRTHSLLREQTDLAYALIAPFFDPANAWNGQVLELLAYRVVREQLPKLSPQDVQIIVATATRMARSKQQ
jgi:hypothetical protein